MAYWFPSKKDIVKLFLKKYWIILMIVTLAIVTPLFAWLNGFSSVNLMSGSEKQELASLISSTAFIMAGLMTFILGQTFSTLKGQHNFMNRYGETHKSALYSVTCHVSMLTIIVCAITGIIAIQHSILAIDWLLSMSLCFLYSIFVLLISTMFLFCSIIFGR